MASSGTKLPAWVVVLVLIISSLSLLCSAASSHSEHGGSLRELFRRRRQECADGTYIFNNRVCCRCPAGQSLKTNCVRTPLDRICEICPEGTYNSEPNNDSSCKPCTSCDQPNANLEVEEVCTAARNAKCKCKKDHYCSSRVDASQPCLLCNPCKKCENDGVKTPCTANEDAVCNSEVIVNYGAIFGSIFGVLVLGGIVGAAAYLKFKKHPQNPKGPTVVTDMPLFNGSEGPTT